MRRVRMNSHLREACSGEALDRQQPREVGDVFELVDAPREVDDALRAGTVEPAPRRAFPELLFELVVAHRIDGAAFAEISRSLDCAAVIELDLDDGGHLI